MIELREYQKVSVDEIRQAMAKYRRVLFQLGTGGGKTVCFSYIAACAKDKGSRVLIVSSRTEVLMQNGSALQRIGLNVSYINPAMRKIPDSDCIVAMAQTLKRRVGKNEWADWLQSVNLLIIDEAHECISDFLIEYLSSDCYVLGVTGTPQRCGHQRQLGSIYKAMVTGVSISELIKLGYLAPVHHYSLTAPKLDIEIDHRIGDYNQQQLAKKFQSKHLYRGLVDEWLRLARGRKTICFCVSAKQCIDTCREFNNEGIKAKFLLSDNSDESAEDMTGARKQIIDEFKRGEFDVLFNVNCLTAGFDCPDVSCVILDFATVSMTRYRQAIGRGSRIAEGKSDFVVLDCGDNWRRLGFYDEDVQWCLWHNESSNGGLEPMKICPTDKPNREGKVGCGAMIPASSKVCPCCGYVYVTDKDIYEMHLEEVRKEQADTIDAFVAEKRLAGWSMSRIMIQVCLANKGNEKKAFMQAYKTLSPGKSERDAALYYYVWRKNVWSHVQRKQLQAGE